MPTLYVSRGFYDRLREEQDRMARALAKTDDYPDDPGDINVTKQEALKNVLPDETLAEISERESDA
jgi:predicted transcriptional regulator